MPSSSTSSQDTKINIVSVQQLNAYFDELHDDLNLIETEHTWQKIERALLRLQAITRGGAFKYQEYVSHIKQLAQPINNALLSERTKLSGTAGDLLNSVAPRLAERFDALLSVFVPTLLLICARTNKIAVKRAEKTLHLIVRHCRLAGLIPYLKEAIRDKGQGLRAVAAGTFVQVLENTDREKLAKRVADIEISIKSGATDSHPEVRQAAKKVFELYISLFPERVESFTKPLTPTIRRYLALPKTGALQVEVPIAPASTTTRAPSSVPSEVPRVSRRDDTASRTSAQPSTSNYNFFPDVKGASLNVRSQQTPNFSINDAAYGRRGLFAEQIAAARSARMARAPTFDPNTIHQNDLPYSHAPNRSTAPVPSRQSSYEQQQRSSSPPNPLFRVRRAENTVCDDLYQPPHFANDQSVFRPGSEKPARSASEMSQATYTGTVSSSSSSSHFAAASGLNGKSALLAAYKQAFLVEKLPSSSSEHQLKRSKSSRNLSDKREKTATVRFEQIPALIRKEAEESPQDQDEGGQTSPVKKEVTRSKSAPHISSDSIEPTAASSKEEVDQLEKQGSDSTTDSHRPKTPEDGAAERLACEKEHPSKQHLQSGEGGSEAISSSALRQKAEETLAQTPGQGKKASRVPAQRVAVAAKIPATRVAVPTPSAKLPAVRIATSSESDASTPTVATTPTVIAKPALNATETKPSKASVSEATKPSLLSKKPQVASTKTASKPVAASTKKPKEKETKAPSNPSAGTKVAAKTAGASSSTSSKATTAATIKVAKAKVDRVSTTAAKATGPTVRPTSSVDAKLQPAKARTPTTQPQIPNALSKNSSDRTTSVPKASITSRLTASTASSRNKMIPAASVKKFQPKPTTVQAAKSRPKSSVSTSLNAKSKLVGVNSAASHKANLVKKAGASMVAKLEKHRRASLEAQAQQKPSVNKDVDPSKNVSNEEKAVPKSSDASEKVEQGPTDDQKLGTEQAVYLETSVRPIDNISTNSTQEDVWAREVVPEAPLVEIQHGAAEASTCPEPSPEEVAEAEAEETETVAEEASEVTEAGAEEIQQVSEEVPEAPQHEAEEEAHVTSESEPPTDQACVMGSEHASVELVEEIPLHASPAKIVAENQALGAEVIRTPLGIKNTNLPRATPSEESAKRMKTFPRLIQASENSPIVSTPKRQQSPTRFYQFEVDSFDDVDSDSDPDDMDEVRQLQFSRTQHLVVEADHSKIHKPNGTLQLVIAAQDDNTQLSAAEDDETILIE